MPVLPLNIQSKIVDQTALAGLNTFDDPKDIADQESSAALNVVYDNGYVGPRKGTFLHRAKPVGEAADPFQILVATNSVGMDFAIVNYGLNFYLDDITNNQWIKINQGYTPATAGQFYGYNSWNNGLGDDRFYFGNGYDAVAKWIPALSTLKIAALPADTMLTLVSSIGFPASGNVIVMNAGVPFLVSYSANDTSTGILTVSGTVGQNVPIGSSVTVPIVTTAIPKSSIFIKFQGRLFGANSFGFENTINYSNSGDPENYTIDGTATTAGVDVIVEGRGGIISLQNYGAFMVISKEDMQIQYSFQFSSDNSDFIAIPNTIISGDGIGPVSNQSLLNYMNVMYYLTEKEGLVSFSPEQTGTSTTTGLSLLSQKINNLVTGTLNLQMSRTAGLNQKLYWLCSQPLIGIPETFNNLVLVYDLIRSAWTTYDNLNATDIRPVNEVLYYLSQNDGGMYQFDVDYQDSVSGNPIAYTASFFTKRYNMGRPERLMTPVYAYAEGIITSTTKLYCDVLYNENGSLGKQTFLIDGANNTLVKSAIIGGYGAFPLATPILGGLDLITMNANSGWGFFRAYMQLSQAYKSHNLTLRFYSVDIGSQWGVTNHTVMTIPFDSVETELVIGPTDTPPPLS